MRFTPENKSILIRQVNLFLVTIDRFFNLYPTPPPKLQSRLKKKSYPIVLNWSLTYTCPKMDWDT